MIEGRPALVVLDAAELRAALGIVARVDVKGLAAAECVSETTVKQWKRRGWIPWSKIGRKTLFDVDACRRALAQRFGTAERKTA